MTAALASEAHTRALELAITRHEPRFAEQVERELRGLTREAVRRFTRNQETLTAAADPERIRIPIPQELANASAAQSAIERIVTRSRGKASKAAINRMSADLGVSFDVRNRILDGVIASQAGAKISTAPEELVRDMMGSLQESYDKGSSVPHAAAAMREIGYTHAKGYGERVARTELLRGVNSASLALVHTTGAAKYKVWMATNDQRTRRSHRNADSQIVGVKESFSVGGARLQYPGDPNGPGEEVIMCRCTLGYTDESGFGESSREPEVVEEVRESEGVPETWGIPNQDARGTVKRDFDRAMSSRAEVDTPGLADRNAALDRYFGFDFTAMNSKLRGVTPKKIPGLTPSKTRDVDGLIANVRKVYELEGEYGVLTRDALLLRGIKANPADFKASSMITDPAFLSTTTHEKMPAFAAVFGESGAGKVSMGLRMHAPAGTKFIPNSTTTGSGIIDELLLEPGTRYVIVGPSKTPLPSATGEGTIPTFDAIILKPGESPRDAIARLSR